MVNRVTLIGNLGADPEIRTAQSGNQIANLRLATSDRQKDANGNWTDHTEWHRVVCFGRTAENVARFLRKGSKVYVEGKIQTRKWTNKEGQDQYTTEIVAFDVKFLDSKGGGERQREDGYGGGDSGRPDDDIPFLWLIGALLPWGLLAAYAAQSSGVV